MDSTLLRITSKAEKKMTSIYLKSLASENKQGDKELLGKTGEDRNPEFSQA